MNDSDLAQINAERRRKGLPPLSKIEAARAVSSNTASADSGFDLLHFLISYQTGFPMPSSAGIMGAIMHPTDSGSSSYSSPDTSPSCSSSYDSGSSSSFDGGSSSSFDSGSCGSD